ncbi:TfpX/TfpZ family type IV pilin accessory protein [Acinetobacter guillouiae]|uniref:TfpX/TfpZ family type IV pilin accessory protein n=1 Tax=Acinetobacter guillouiae TaxID=106649 RepID=UPI002FDB1143
MSKRLKFFSGHLLISVLIALISIWLVFFVWYPAPLAEALGVGHLFLMLIFIDVMLGPLLGLIIYKEGKKSLKFDLTVIILIQIMAFGYGFNVIAQGRPAWIIYDSMVFHVLKKSDIDTSRIDQAKLEFQNVSWLKPQFANLDISSTQFRDNPPLNGTIAIDHPMYFTDISNAKRQMQSVSFPISLLEKYNDNEQIRDVIQKYPQADAWAGLSAPAKDMVVLINKEKGEVVKIVDLRPWK